MEGQTYIVLYNISKIWHFTWVWAVFSSLPFFQHHIVFKMVQDHHPSNSPICCFPQVPQNIRTYTLPQIKREVSMLQPATGSYRKEKGLKPLLGCLHPDKEERRSSPSLDFGMSGFPSYFWSPNAIGNIIVELCFFGSINSHIETHLITTESFSFLAVFMSS